MTTNSNGVPMIFIDNKTCSVPVVRHGATTVITTRLLAEPSRPANDRHPDTDLTALRKLQQMRKFIAFKQRQNLPFKERQSLHQIWKRLAALERRIIRRLFG